MRFLGIIVILFVLFAVNLYAGAGVMCTICGKCVDEISEKTIGICQSGLADIKEDAIEAALMRAHEECEKRLSSIQISFKVEQNSCDK